MVLIKVDKSILCYSDTCDIYDLLYMYLHVTV